MSTLLIPPTSLRFTVLLGLLAALPSISIDISIPTLLRVQTELGASVGLVGQTITLFMVGFAVGQFGAGPMSDRYGRRPVILAGLSAYTLATTGCALAGSVGWLIAWRFSQGVAAGSSTVLAFAIIRDLFEGDAARSKRSYVTVVFGLAPMLAPTLGAWMMGFMGWRPIYLVLALCGFMLFAVVYLGVGESRPPALPKPRAQSILAAYRSVLQDQRFRVLAVVNALSYGAMFAYIAGSAVVMMGDLQLSAQAYAAFFACTAASLTAGAWVSGRCAVAGVTSSRLLSTGLALAAVSALLLCGLILGGSHALWLAVPLLLVNLFCRGLVAPNAQHLALDPMRGNAGTAAAAIGVMQILAGAISSALVAVLLTKFGPLGMAAVMAVLGTLAATLWIWASCTWASFQVHTIARVAPSPGRKSFL